MANKRVMKRKEGCYLCGTLNAYHNGPGLSPTRNFSRIKRPHIGLNEFDGKWYLIADGVPYPVKHLIAGESLMKTPNLQLRMDCNIFRRFRNER